MFETAWASARMVAAGLFALACLFCAVALAAGEWATVPLFDGRSTKGWVESSGRWRINSGWLSGFHKDGRPPILNFSEALPPECDLGMSVWNRGGYVSIVLAESGPVPAPGGKSYEFGLGWVQNTRLLIVKPNLNHPETVYMSMPFDWVPGRIYRLTWAVRAAGIDFAIDGTRVAQVPGPISPTGGWRLTLQSHAARDTVIAFSAVEARVPAEDAERIRSSTRGATYRSHTP